MALLRVPINITWAGAGSPGVNVWSVRAGGSLPGDVGPSLQEAVDEIHAFYTFLVANGTTPACIYPAGSLISLGEVVDRDSSESHTPSFSSISTTPGGTPAPPALQVVVGWKTSVRARRGMGRTFLGPLAIGCIQTDGTVAPGVITQVNSAAQALLDASTGAGNWALGIYGQESKLPAGATPADRRAAPHVHRDLKDFSVKDRFAILRSRRD